MVMFSHDIKTRIALIEASVVEREYLLALVAGVPGVIITDAYSSLAAALPELENDPPDLVIGDLDGANSSAVAWLKQLRTILPHTSVLVLSAEIDRDELFAALEAGVSGWLQKPCTADEILRAMVQMHEGGAVLSSSVARKVIEYFQARGSSVRHLSHREREILRLMGQGTQAADIAERLGLSRFTVRTHVRNLLLKLEANSRAEAVAKYLNPAV